ncbi:MAG: hypothetical protein L0Y66_21430 [Myxococcaceae bacterium]|nr:hypothetical protein [Myxococcaceae bacterium]
MRSPLLLALAALPFAAGCSHAPVVYPPAPPVYYAVSFHTARSTQAGQLPHQSDLLAKDAPQLLRPGQRVAFLPPDSCVTGSVSPSGAAQNSTSILMLCGALLASLEAEVAKSGYSVVSWQALKASGAADSLQRARSMSVDILFEVNQLSQESRDPGAQQVSNLRFTREEGPGRATPIPVMPAVAERCAGQLAGLQREGDREHLSTVNLKAMEVSSGRALWLYQNTVLELEGRDERNQSKLYYRAEGVRPSPPSVESGSLGAWGGALAGLGVGVAAGGLLGGLADPDTDTSAYVGGGALAAGAGLGMMGIDYLISKPDRTVPPATYPSEDQVICASAPQSDPWVAPATPAVQFASAQYSYTFTKSATANRDLSRERIERLIRKSTEDFVQALRQIVRR